ncbi:MAG TPA: OB-fold domain-containing protein [Candidatus Bathyarchaeia archaeon]|nr:OB-fold domain-containing protein [Candidatus Bathyarchaeia archaeon]
MIVPSIQASRCPRCHRIVVPAARHCPDHPVAMEQATVPGVGEVVSFTTLHSPPEGFKAPLHIALIELEGGARLFCHGEGTQGIRIGSSVGVESLDNVFYFSHMSFADRARLFWRRAGAGGEKVASITKSLAKGIWRGRSRGDR